MQQRRQREDDLVKSQRPGVARARSEKENQSTAAKAPIQITITNLHFLHNALLLGCLLAIEYLSVALVNILRECDIRNCFLDALDLSRLSRYFNLHP